MQDPFHADVTASGEEIEVRVHGDVDVHTAARLSEQLGELVASQSRRIVVDLRDVPFCDSTGLSVLVRSSTKMRDSGRALVLKTPSPQVRRILDITGLEPLFTIEG